MKKLIASAPVTMVILFSFIPLLYIIGYCAGYTLVLRFGPELIALLGIYSIVVLLNLSEYKVEMDKTNVILTILTLPLAFLTGLCVLAEFQSLPSIIFSIICIVCSVVLLGKTTSNDSVKRFHRPIAVILVMVLGIHAFTSLYMNSYNSNKSESVVSPGGTYTAQIIQTNPKATVEVWESKRNIELYVFYYVDRPQRITVKNTDPTDNIAISFADEHTLVINDIPYTIK